MSLDPLNAGHAETLFPLLREQELWCYTEEDAPANVEALRERYRRWEARRSPDGTELWLNWAVVSHEHGAAGFVQATVSGDREVAEIAYVIGKPFWLLGLGTEAVTVLLAFLHDGLGVRRAVASVDQRNVASLRLLKKLRFAIVDARDVRNLRLERTLEPG